MIGIEYVCTANGFRSPIAETKAKKQVIDLGLENKIQIYSSGSHYETLQTMKMDNSYLKKNIEMGLEKGFYTKEQQRQAENLLEGYKDKMTLAITKMLAKITEDKLTEEEEHFRKIILEEAGLKYEGKSKQYKPKKEIQIVLPMSEKNTKKCIEISGGSQTITPIRQYVGLEGEFENPFGQGIEICREVAQKIMECATKSIEKVAGEYL